LGFFTTAKEVERLAASVPDSGGVIVVPAFTGLGAPHWRPDARGLITGLTRGTSRAHLARATLEGIALQNVDILRAMERDSGRTRARRRAPRPLGRRRKKSLTRRALTLRLHAIRQSPVRRSLAGSSLPIRSNGGFDQPLVRTTCGFRIWFCNSARLPVAPRLLYGRPALHRDLREKPMALLALRPNRTPADWTD